MVPQLTLAATVVLNQRVYKSPKEADCEVLSLVQHSKQRIEFTTVLIHRFNLNGTTRVQSHPTESKSILAASRDSTKVFEKVISRPPFVH